MRNYSAPTVAVLAASLAVSACGASNSTSSRSTSGSQPTPSAGTAELPRAEFVKKADAICRANDKANHAAGLPNFDPATVTKAQLASSARFFAALSKSIPLDVSKVSALGEPKEAAAKRAWRELRASLETTSIPNIQKVDSDVRAGDIKAFRADFKKFSSTDPIQTKDGMIVGFKVCGQG